MLQVIQKQNKISKKEILSAIKENRVIIYLQPIYSTKLKRITSAEVLVRISDKKGNIIYPADFINYAEKTGLIHKIESIVFTKACEFISTNGLKTLGLDYLEINLSVKKGESVKLFKEYYEIINKYNVSPKELNLEITETSIITKRNILLNNIINLKNFGINFSLDDYGTGESNLNYIIDMPLSIIKIDKSIMDNYFNNDKARIILPNIIKMAHNINLKVVIEGIETEEQFYEMIKIGADYIQGYYIAKPLNEEEFIKFISIIYHTDDYNLYRLLIIFFIFQKILLELLTFLYF